MKLFKIFLVTLIAINSFNVYAQTKDAIKNNDVLFLRSIPEIEDFINNLLYPDRKDLRGKPGNTQSA